MTEHNNDFSYLDTIHYSCLECRLCCHFPEYFEEGSAINSPELEEACGVAEKFLPDFFEKISEHSFLYRPVCKSYEEESAKCQNYADRPLLCRLFPFQLFLREDKVIIALDPDCPDSQKLYDQYLKKETVMIDFLHHLVNDLSTFSEQECIYDFELEDMLELIQVDIVDHNILMK